MAFVVAVAAQLYSMSWRTSGGSKPAQAGTVVLSIVAGPPDGEDRGGLAGPSRGSYDPLRSLSPVDARAVVGHSKYDRELTGLALSCCEGSPGPSISAVELHTTSAEMV